MAETCFVFYNHIELDLDLEIDSKNLLVLVAILVYCVLTVFLKREENSATLHRRFFEFLDAFLPNTYNILQVSIYCLAFKANAVQRMCA